MVGYLVRDALKDRKGNRHYLTESQHPRLSVTEEYHVHYRHTSCLHVQFRKENVPNTIQKVTT
jgi:hypothetical protein